MAATKDEKETLTFGFQIPEYKRSQFKTAQIRSTIEQRVAGLVANGLGTTASKNVDPAEAAPEDTEAKKVKTEEKPATAMADEDEDDALMVSKDFLGVPAVAPVSINKTLTLIGEDGKLAKLFPRENPVRSANPATPVKPELFDESDLPTDPKQREKYLQLINIAKEAQIKDEVEKQMRHREVETKAVEFQKKFEEVLKKIMLGSPLTTTEIESVDKGVWDAVNRESLPSLNCMNSLLTTLSKASETQEQTHSKMQTVHDMNLKLSEKNKYLKKLHSEKEKEVLELKAKLEALEHKSNTPLFVKQEERLKPKEQIQTGNDMVKTASSKRGREDAESIMNTLDQTSKSIFREILVRDPYIDIELALNSTREIVTKLRQEGGY